MRRDYINKFKKYTVDKGVVLVRGGYYRGDDVLGWLLIKRVSNFVTAVLHLNTDSINILLSTPP